MNDYAAQDVIVVGGGIAGLSAAAYLARAGVAVTLFEKSARLGGRAATQENEGYYFNRGAHALYPGGAATRVLRELGVTYQAGHPRGVLALRGGTLSPLPADPASLFQTNLLNRAEKWEMMRLLVGVVVRPAAALRPLSITRWLDGHASPRVGQVLAGLARTFTYSAALDQVSAEVFATQMKLAMRPVEYVAGGWQTLVDGLARVAEQAGARLMRSTAVAALEPGPDGVRGVRLADGRLVPGRAVILATELSPAAQLLGALDPTAAEHLAEGVAIQVACLDVALRRLPVPGQAVVFDLDGPHFQTAQSVFTRVAPAGGALVHTFKYLDPAQPSDPHEDAQELETLLDRTQPGWREVLVHRQYLPRISAAGWMPTARSGGLAGRPAPQVPGWANLFLAGDWVGSEGFLLDASLASARQVARLVGAAVPAAARPPQPVAPEVLHAR